jgi:hypothetical protein
MAKWFSFGKQVTEHGPLPLTERFNVADFPPGTPLPPVPKPDVSDLSPRARRRVEKKWPQIAARQQAQLERLRDEFYRRRSEG